MLPKERINPGQQLWEVMKSQAPEGIDRTKYATQYATIVFAYFQAKIRNLATDPVASTLMTTDALGGLGTDPRVRDLANKMTFVTLALKYGAPKISGELIKAASAAGNSSLDSERQAMETNGKINTEVVSQFRVAEGEGTTIKRIPLREKIAQILANT